MAPQWSTRGATPVVTVVGLLLLCLAVAAYRPGPLRLTAAGGGRLRSLSDHHGRLYRSTLPTPLPRSLVAAAAPERPVDHHDVSTASRIHLAAVKHSIPSHPAQGSAPRTTPTRSAALALALRGTLVAAAAFFALRGRRTVRWATASTGEHPNDDLQPPKAKNTLASLESLLGPDSKDSPLPKSAPDEHSSRDDHMKAKTTLASLENLLGPDPKDSPPPKPAPVADSSPPPSREDQMKAATAEVRQKLTTIESEKDVEDLRLKTKELVDLVGKRQLMRRIPLEDVKRMKDDVLAPSHFWLSSAEDAMEFVRTGFIGGHLFRGHARGDTAQTIAEVLQRSKEVFGPRYEVVVVPEPPKYGEDAAWLIDDPPAASRPAFLMVIAEEVEQGPVTRTQYGVAVLVALLTLFTIYFTGVGVGISNLDPKLLQSLVDTDNAAGLEDLFAANLPTILLRALPVGSGVFASAVAHEVAHRLVAAQSKVPLGPPYFLPSLSLGTFGAITKLRGLAPDWKALFDIAAAGPVAGAVAASLFFGAGLALTGAAPPGDPALVPLPQLLLDSSLLLGGVARAALGDGPVQCHPFVLAGWCGLIASALNVLPLGSTDGGRMFQAAFSRTAKQVAAFVVYLLLALDLLAPGVGFTWGVAAIFLQRGSERNIRDQYTAIDPKRRVLSVAILVLAFLLLVPSPAAVFGDLPTIY